MIEFFMGTIFGALVGVFILAILTGGRAARGANSIEELFYWEAGDAVEGPDVEQIIYALERVETELHERGRLLFEQNDYSAEFPLEDADRMREAIGLLQRRVAVSAAVV